ncbi:pyruvate kinase [Clostridium sp.]|uniref:pyruvate kinase n=1 Tax=Clostridium sp. TaxID=1506 RepID=UPI003F314B9D
MHIIATVGPRSQEKWVLKEFIENGVDIIRLNCSHFNESEFNNIVSYVREIDSNVKIMADLCGRKIRVSETLESIYKIYNGEEVYFCGEDFYNTISKDKIKDMRIIPITVTAESLLKSDISNISMKDNSMNFEILEKKHGIIKAKVMRGGIIRGGKGCNISNLNKDYSLLSNKDKDNVKWALKNNIDIICQSYVESDKELVLLKNFINKTVKNNMPKLWAKVETPLGIENLNKIITVTDNIVIGRGDLVPEAGILRAVELETEAVDFIVSKNKNIIIATHLLNSMKNAERATLPEVECIYSFIKKGVKGFLLAGETSIGRAPTKTVIFFNNTIKYYEGEEIE